MCGCHVPRLLLSPLLLLLPIYSRTSNILIRLCLLKLSLKFANQRSLIQFDCWNIHILVVRYAMQLFRESYENFFSYCIC
ncbi:hypothetical protein BGZ63DRAFT_383020 [Mariannaea sp. PMI_226]|nr:hypothetical protein BGZ63DRAFT_383020 [Mariannaea sp. PMI_226]